MLLAQALHSRIVSWCSTRPPYMRGNYTVAVAIEGFWTQVAIAALLEQLEVETRG